MVAGRPRTTTPEYDDLVELGKELVQWATEPSEKLRCRFAQWYSLEKGILDKEWDLMLQKPEFRGYYETARAALAERFVDGSVKDSIGHRFLRIYAPEVRHREDLDHTHKLERELEKEKKKIAFEFSQKQVNETPPLSQQIDLENEVMVLKAQLAESNKIINELKSS